MSNLDNQVIIITGASSGIGEATARHLASLGARVVLGARRADRLARLADSIGPNASWQVTDVTRREDLKALAAHALEKFGRIDGLINNAGIMPVSMIASGMVEDWGIGRAACRERVKLLLVGGLLYIITLQKHY